MNRIALFSMLSLLLNAVPAIGEHHVQDPPETLTRPDCTTQRLLLLVDKNSLELLSGDPRRNAKCLRQTNAGVNQQFRIRIIPRNTDILAAMIAGNHTVKVTAAESQCGVMPDEELGDNSLRKFVVVASVPAQTTCSLKYTIHVAGIGTIDPRVRVVGPNKYNQALQEDRTIFDALALAQQPDDTQLLQLLQEVLERTKVKPR